MHDNPSLFTSAIDGMHATCTSVELLRFLEVGHHRGEEAAGFSARHCAMIESERQRKHLANGRRAVDRDDRIAQASRSDDRNGGRHHHG